MTQRLAQKPPLTETQSVRKGAMTLLRRLLFWFVIKNVVPRGQGRNLAHPMDMCFTDPLDRCEKINLPKIIISHIARITNTSKDHDMWYGFLLTSVFEELGIPLQNKVGFQVNDEIGSSTLVVCGFTVTKGTSAGSEQGPQTPFGPVLGSASISSMPTF